MRVLDTYFARSIISGIIVSTALFAGLFFFIFFIKELKFVGTADYDVTVAILYVLLNLPQQLYELAPSIILVGSLVALGAMAAASEIVVVRTAGMSTMAFTRMVLQAGLLVAVAVAALGEYVVPRASELAASIRVHAMNERVLAGGGHGLWSRDGNRYINIGTVQPDGMLHRVFIYEIDDAGRLLAMTSVARAVPVDAGWELHDVRESRISDDRVDSEHTVQKTTARLIQPDLFDVLKTEPENMSAGALYQYGRYLEANELDADIFHLQFWIKVFTPVTCMVMLLIALPLVFTASARSGGIGQRIVIGLAIGIMFYVFNRMVNYLGLSYGMPPALSAALPPLLAAGVVFLLMRRV